MEKAINNEEEIRVLLNALNADQFRFILLRYNHFALLEEVLRKIKEHYPHKTILDLRLPLPNNVYLVDEIIRFGKGIVFVRNFEEILKQEAQAAALNIRREGYSSLPISIIACIPEGSEVYRSIRKAMPDLWSIKNLEIELWKEIILQPSMEFQNLDEFSSSLTGKEKEERIKLLQKQFEGAKLEAESKRLAGKLALEVGVLLSHIGEYAESKIWVEKAIKIGDSIDNLEMQATGYLLIGYNNKFVGKLNEALAYYEQSLNTWRKIRNKIRIANTLRATSHIFTLIGDYDKAMKYLDESLALQRETGNFEGEGRTLGSIAALAQYRGDFELAYQIAENSLDIFRKTGDNRGESFALNFNSLVLISLGKVEKGIQYAEDSLRISREIGNKRGEAITLLNLARIANGTGNKQEFERKIMEVWEISNQFRDVQLKYHTAKVLGNFFIRENRKTEALPFLREAVAIGEHSGFTDSQNVKELLQSIES